MLFSATLFDRETTGQLSLAMTAVALPMAIFGQTTAQAYFGEVARIGRNNPTKLHAVNARSPVDYFT